MTPAKIDLGRMLFYEPRLSKGHDVSGNSCHSLDNYGVDGKRVSTGFQGQWGGRNSPTVYTAAGHISRVIVGGRHWSTAIDEPFLHEPHFVALRNGNPFAERKQVFTGAARARQVHRLHRLSVVMDHAPHESRIPFRHLDLRQRRFGGRDRFGRLAWRAQRKRHNEGNRIGMRHYTACVSNASTKPLPRPAARTIAALVLKF